MNVIKIKKKINPEQLSFELLGNELRIVGPEPDGTYKIKSDLPEAAIEAAVDRHKADDNWKHPNPKPESPKPEPSLTEDEIKKLRKLVGGV